MRCLALTSLLWCALASAGTADILWTYPTHNVPGPTAGGTLLTDLADFLLYRRCDAGTLELVATVPASTAAPTGGETGAYTDVQPDDGRTCWYSIVARNALGEESVRTGEVSKTFLADASPPGDVSATFTWTTTPIEGPPDVGTSSIRFDASGDYARRSANLPSATAFTIAGWFRIVSDRTGNWRMLMAIQDGSTWKQIGWTNADVFGARNTGNNATITAPPTDGTWFYAFIQSSGGTSAVKAGWRKLGDAVWTTGTTATSSAMTPTSVSWGTNTDSQYVNADLVYPRLWDAELSEAELLSEMLSTSPVRTSNLNHASSDDGVDTSGNARDLTLNGTSTGSEFVLGQTVSSTSDPLSQSITVPDDVTNVIVAFAYYPDRTATITLGGVSPDYESVVPNNDSMGFAVWDAPATGAQTLTIDWSGALGAGAVAHVFYVFGRDVFGGASYKDQDAYSGTASVTSTVSSIAAEDLVLRFESRYSPASVPALDSGWTSAGSGSTGTLHYRASYKLAGGTSQSATTDAGNGYPTLQLLAFQPASGGAAASLPPINQSVRQMAALLAF